jgi:hypothetical protein
MEDIDDFPRIRIVIDARFPYRAKRLLITLKEPLLRVHIAYSGRATTLVHLGDPFFVRKYLVIVPPVRAPVGRIPLRIRFFAMW